MAIERRAEFLQAAIDLSQHAEAEESVGGNVLSTTELCGRGAAVAARQTEQWADRFPEEIGTRRPPKDLHHGHVARQEVEARIETVHPMNKQDEMDPGRPPDRI